MIGRVLVSALAVAACCRAAKADECDAMASRFVARSGAQLEARTAGSVALWHPAGSVYLVCGPEEPRAVYIQAGPDRYASPAFYAVVGLAAEAVLGVGLMEAYESARACEERAQRSGEIVDDIVGAVQFVCRTSPPAIMVRAAK